MNSCLLRSTGTSTLVVAYSRCRPNIVISFYFQRYSLQLTGTVSESGTCTCELLINRPKHSMFTAFASSSQVRLSSITNTQGSPSDWVIVGVWLGIRHGINPFGNRIHFRILKGKLCLRAPPGKPTRFPRSLPHLRRRGFPPAWMNHAHRGPQCRF